MSYSTARSSSVFARFLSAAWYAGIRADDLDAIVAYLRTLPPLAR